MQINNNLHNYHAVQTNHLSGSQHNNSEAKTTPQTIVNKVSISNTARNADNNWLKIAQKYDVTNLSSHERGEMTRELVNSGVISSDIGLALVAPISVGHDPNTKVDYLRLTEDNLNFHKSHTSSGKQTILLERTLTVLEKLYNLSNAG